MKVLLRRMFDCPPVARWRRFEAALSQALMLRGHHILQLDLDPDLPPDPQDAAVRIYAHKTRREVPHAHLYFKEMHMQGLFTLDTEGWGADHSAAKQSPDLSAMDDQLAEAFALSVRQSFLTSGHSKHKQPQLRPLPAEIKPYVFVPLQSPDDDVIRYHSPMPVLTFLHRIADWACETGMKVVFKIHPGFYSEEIETAALKRAAAHPLVFCLDENVHALIQEAEGVFVLNSGVGFESLIHGKPVVTFGNCDYRWATFPAEADHMGAALAYVRTHGDAERKAGYRFIHHYYTRHAYDFGHHAHSPNLGQTIERLNTYLDQVFAPWTQLDTPLGAD